MLTPFILTSLFSPIPTPPTPTEVFIAPTEQSAIVRPLEELKLEPVEELPLYVVGPATGAQNSPNNYPVGQCTHYAKSRRPDLPNSLGDARYWYGALASMGWSVGLTPQAGAIGQSKTGNHVVYIEKVEGSQVYLSERNYDYNGSYRERWAPASSFYYIY